jgi:methionyl-tRNA formyltransferase
MFDTIILLTGPVEQGPLEALLHGHHPHLAIHSMSAADEFAAFDVAFLKRARLLAFASPVIVPGQVLDGLGFGAYNFHPGSTDYPGWAPAHFALYDGVNEFGATVHVMAELVDCGPIIDAVRFPIPPDISAQGLEGLAYAHLAQLFWRLSKALAIQAEPLPTQALQWSPKKNSRRAYQAICNIPLDISKEELDRRMRVFGGNHYGIAPTIKLHGVEFRAVV